MNQTMLSMLAFAPLVLAAVLLVLILQGVAWLTGYRKRQANDV